MRRVPGAILLVDDDDQSIIVAEAMLQKAFGPTVKILVAHTSKEAWELRGQANVALIDYYLGDEVGLDLLERLLAGGFDGPIILLTGKEDPQLDLQAMQAGAADYLVKGHFNLASLERSIRYAMARHHAETAVDNLAAIADASDDAIFSVSLAGEISSWNHAAEHMYGFSAHEVVGRPLSAFRDFWSAQLADDAWPLVTFQGLVHRVEGIHRHRTGRPIPVFLTVSPLRGLNGRIRAVAAIARDLTAQRTAERALWESQARFGALMEHSPMAALLVNPAGRVIYANACALDLLQEPETGAPPEAGAPPGGEATPQAGATPWAGATPRAEATLPFRTLEVCRSCCKADLEGLVEKVRKAENRVDTTLVCARADEGGATSTRQWMSIGFPVDDGSEHSLVGIVAVEITEKKQFENRILQLQKMEALGRLAGAVAHDFNNLLTVINGHLDLLLRAPGTDENARQALGEVREAGERAIHLTQQLLAFSRKGGLGPRLVEVNGIVRGMGRMLHRLMGEDITLQVTYAEKDTHIRVDPAQFEQVLMNLALNARDAMTGGGRLSIVIEVTRVLPVGMAPPHGERHDGDWVLLQVSDTGCGMPPRVVEHVFEPFFTTKEEGRGTGLGLATVYGVVASSRGHVDVTSEVNRGTTFRIFIPVCDVEAVAPEQSAPPPSARGSETVLVVEDDASVRRLATLILRRQGYTVLEATDGADVKAGLEAGTFEGVALLITDVVLPGISGDAVATLVKAALPAVRVVYLSGYMEADLKKRGFTLDIGTFMSKPFAPDALARKVRDVLDG